MSYLNVTEVESALIGLAAAYPSICELITLPHTSVEGRTCHAIRVGASDAAAVPAALFTGVVHAREWGGSEVCVNLAADLCEAYTAGTGLAYGGMTFTTAEIKAIVDGLSVIGG
jgi:murein tripeptide amidase MpaA